MKPSVLAVAVWGRTAPSHSITAVMITDDQQTIVTGSQEGQICLWDLSSDLQVCALEMCVWNVTSGQCIENTKLPYRHTAIHVYDYCDFSLLCTEFCKRGQCFAGGEVLAAYRLIIWTEDGHSYIYQLLNSGLSKSMYPADGKALKETVYPHLLSFTGMKENKLKDQSVVCCVCSDHSVAILHLQKRQCLLHARKHLFPVKKIKFDPLENVLIVGCEDNSVYIWEIETGTLERHETGDTARAILTAIEDSEYLVADALLPVSQESKRRKSSGYKHSSSYKHGMGPYPTHTEKSSDKLTDTSCIQQPFTILPAKTKWNNENFHILLFDLEKLEELLSSQLNGLKSSKSLHNQYTLERAKSTTEKRALTLKRNKTAAFIPQVDGQAETFCSDQVHRDNNAARPMEDSGGIKRWKKMKSSRKIRMEPSGNIDVNIATDTAKLLLSCLLPWGVDKEIDNLCARHLDILRLQCPVSFGLVSDESHLSLMLPGWKCTDCGMLEEHGVLNLFSKRVLDLSNKYLAATEGQFGKKDGPENNDYGTRDLETVFFLFSRIALINRIINTPSAVTDEIER
ncbi:WD repeat-containing protein 72 [Lonchura striata]|uniref:WD repeat-containing protein 72 n=1 Tax=Lonchura striata TaxID=40157 RepID=A0A218V854_9PASE|nr:WD repeat-containing protein 72 [Lonchura striata domestica]